MVQENQPAAAQGWHTRLINQINNCERKLDELIPNNSIQKNIDSLVERLEKKFSPLYEFNKWLNSNGDGKWYQQLATFLVKLPARSVRNIIQLLYNIIKGIVYAATHPLKSLTHLAKMLIALAHELTKPEVWSKMGVGLIGAGLGQSLVTGDPMSVIEMGIGAAMVIGGVSVGALRAALEAEKDNRLEAAKQNLFSQAKELPESMLTGFCMGLITGAIQRAIRESQPKKNIVEQREVYGKQRQSHEVANLESSKALKAVDIGKFPTDFPKKGTIIYADVANVGVIDGSYSHFAFYEKGGSLKKEMFITSAINDSTGMLKNGTQIVKYGNKLISESANWVLENLNGVIYYVHIHEKFLVYSSDYTQYIIRI